MHKLKLKLFEIQTLILELKGTQNSLNKDLPEIKGLMNQKLSLPVKFDLSRLLKSVKPFIEDFESLRNELIISLGEEKEDGTYGITSVIEKEDSVSTNPNFVKFVEQINELQSKEVEVEIPSFKIEQFENLETEEYYDIFFKILEEINKGE